LVQIIAQLRSVGVGGGGGSLCVELACLLLNTVISPCGGSQQYGCSHFSVKQYQSLVMVILIVSKVIFDYAHDRL
jgi:hypothetical protein